MNDTRAIGVFDSGVGGLSVLKELIALMPKENYIFVADQFNIPYGEKTKRELQKITLKICNFFVSQNSKIIIMACNTATCYALDFLRSEIKIPIIGTVPAIKPAAEKSRSGVIGIISTPATSKSAYLKSLIKSYAKDLKIVNIGCPNLENAVETGNFNSQKVNQLLNKYIKPVKKSGADIIVLGCTHYPFLKTQIKNIAGTNLQLLDSGKAIAMRAKKILQQLSAINKSGGKIDFYTTGEHKPFSKIASSLLKKRIEARHLILKI